MSVILKPYAIVQGQRNTQPVLSGRLPARCSRSCPAQSVDVIVTSPPYNMGIRYNSYEDTLSAVRLPGVDQHVDRGGRAGAQPGRVALPERRHAAVRPLDGARRRAGGAAHLQAAEHHPLDQVDRHRSRPRPARPPASTRDLAVGHYKPINSDRFLNDCHEFVFHFTPAADTRLDRLALGVPYQDQSNIARWRAARRRRPLPRQHLVHSVRDHPAPRSRPAASGDVPVAAAGAVPAGCTACRGSERRWIRSPGLGSTAVACARLGVNFVGADIDETYLEEAVERVARDRRTRALPGARNGADEEGGPQAAEGRAGPLAVLSQRPDAAAGCEHVLVARPDDRRLAPRHLHLDLAAALRAGPGWSSSTRARSSRSSRASIRFSALSKSFMLTTARPPVSSASTRRLSCDLRTNVVPLAADRPARRCPTRRPGRAGRSCRSWCSRGSPTASSRRARGRDRRR